MNREKIDKIMLIGNYMELENISVDGNGVYFGKGNEYYNPDSDWNVLMKVCKKIIGSYYSERDGIYRGLKNTDIDYTFEAVVRFIEFWNDETQTKILWANSELPDWSIKHCESHKNNKNKESWDIKHIKIQKNE